jgi:hypothetical protein
MVYNMLTNPVYGGTYAYGKTAGELCYDGPLMADLKVIWRDPTTDVPLKKRIVRELIHEVIADDATVVKSF